jgi:hypothetical protein
MGGEKDAEIDSRAPAVPLHGPVPLAEEVRRWVEVVDRWDRWEALPRGPTTQELDQVADCLYRLLHTLRSEGEVSGRGAISSAIFLPI